MVQEAVAKAVLKRRGKRKPRAPVLPPIEPEVQPPPEEEPVTPSLTEKLRLQPTAKLPPELPPIEEDEDILFREQEELLAPFDRVFPDIDIPAMFESMDITPASDRAGVILAQQAQDDFINTIQAAGRTPDTESILMQLGLEEEDIGVFFPVVAPPKIAGSPTVATGFEPGFLGIPGIIKLAQKGAELLRRFFERPFAATILEPIFEREKFEEIISRERAEFAREQGIDLAQRGDEFEELSKQVFVDPTILKLWGETPFGEIPNAVPFYAADELEEGGALMKLYEEGDYPKFLRGATEIGVSLPFYLLAWQGFAATGAGQAVNQGLNKAFQWLFQKPIAAATLRRTGFTPQQINAYQEMVTATEKGTEAGAWQGLFKNDTVRREVVKNTIKMSEVNVDAAAAYFSAFSKQDPQFTKIINDYLGRASILKLPGAPGASAGIKTFQQNMGLTPAPVAGGLAGKLPSLPITPQNWAIMAMPDKVNLVKSLGLSGQVVSKAWEALSEAERAVLSQPPVAEVPEAVPEATLSLEEISKYETRIPLDLIRKDEKETLARLTKEIEKDGITEPITIRVREDGSRIVWDGIHRLIVAQDLGIKNVPVKFIGEEVTKPPAVAPEAVRAPTEAVAPEIAPTTPTAEVTPPVTEVKPTEEIKPLPPEKPVTPVEVSPLPPAGSATKKVFSRIQTDPAEPSVREKIRKGFHNFQVKMVDDLYAIKKFTEEATKGGVNLSIEEDPYMLARLLKGVTSKSTVFLETGTFGKKFWKMEQGKAVPDLTGESLENILKEVHDPTQWRDFSTYLVARRTIQLSARDIETGIDVADAQATVTELEAKYKNFPRLAERTYKYQDNLLVYAQEMGLLSKGLLARLRKFGDYVPFYRVFNELQSKGFMGKKMANISSPIKRIKGSEKEIINPLESIVKNTYTLINAADRNQIGIAMANLVDQNPEIAELFERVKTPMARVARVDAKELGVDIEGLSDEDANSVVDIFRPSFFVSGDEVTVLLDGKKAYFKVDPDVRDALLTLDQENIGMIGKFLGLPAKWLRAGATLSPDFMVRNPARDQLTAFAYSNYGFLPGVDFMRGVASIIAKDSDYTLFRQSGAEHSMMVSMDRQYLSKTFKEIVETKKFKDYVKHPLELFQIGSELGEKATRLGEFKGGIRRGAQPLEAGFSARSVSLDFAQAGTTARAINRLIAFFNANIRGWGRMSSSFREHPTRTAFKVFVGITLPSILLYLANRDDPRWKEIPQWQKDLFWIVMTEDQIFRIPKPFELGIIFGSMPERFLEYLDNKDPKMLEEVMLNMAEAGSPGYIPTALLPIIENLADYSFFRGRAIVPASRQQLPPELQYTRWTGEFSKKVGELLNLSPAKVDNLINGWTGGLGRYATDILSKILVGTGISPNIPEPSPTLADTPVIKAFVVRNPFGSSGESVTTFYETLAEYTSGERFLKEMLSLGEIERFEEFKASHPELLFFHDFENEVAYSASARYLRRVARDLAEIRKKEDEIFKSKTMTAGEKRTLIDQLDKVRFEVARRAMDLFPGEVPPILEKQLSESDNRLGELLEEKTPLSLDKPKFFNTQKLSTDYGRLLEAVPPEDIIDKKGVPPTVKAWYEKEQSEVTQLSLVNTPIYRVDTDKELALLTKRQKELYGDYNAAEDKDEFLEGHPGLKVNPRNEWLRANPIDNARLALWGQAKILTQTAYDEVQRLVKELDIPNNAIPAFTLPPEGSVKNYFKYLEAVDEFSANAWETQLIIAQDEELRTFLNREPIDTPIPALELKIKWRGKEDTPEAQDDMRRIEAIEKGSNEEPTIEKFVTGWVERGKEIDEFSAGSSQAKVFLLDTRNSESPYFGLFDWALAQGLLKDDGGDWNEPVLRIDVEMDKLTEDSDAWRTLDYKKEALSVEGFPVDLTDTYVDWYMTPRKDYEDDWFLQDNPEFHQALVDTGIWKELRDFSKVPTREVNTLYVTYQGLPLGQTRLDYRAQHLNLEAWLVSALDYKPLGDRGDKVGDKADDKDGSSRLDQLSADIAETLERLEKLQ